MINPEDWINECGVDALNTAADHYFESIDDYTHLFCKPFSDLRETADLLESLSFLLEGLLLAKGMTVLDFAAGSCWLSRSLNQMQCRTVSVDVSRKALEIGQELFDSYQMPRKSIAPPEFLHFDGYRIDLDDSSVDRIICNDGFHHVPNQQDVLCELFRVLKPGGVVGMSEPGFKHSQTPQSQYEMREFGVLENDIDVTKIFDIAQSVGFTDIKIAARCRSFISLSEHQSLLADQSDVKLSETLMQNMRTIGKNKVVFFLYKGQPKYDSRFPNHISGKVELLDARLNNVIPVGKCLEAKVRITNVGESVWLQSGDSDIGVVFIGLHLYDEAGQCKNYDWMRFSIDRQMFPGENIVQLLSIAIPRDLKGLHRIAIDLVSESVAWFEQLGHTPAQTRLFNF